MVSVIYYTDPACPWSWAIEPSVRKLMVQFDDQLDWTFVMGGLDRDVVLEAGGRGRELAHARLVREWLRVADVSGVPLDPLLWVEGPIETTYPACMAVKAAADQMPDGPYRYLRRLREGLMCERRKLDQLESLVEEGRAAGLDVERLRIDLRSHGTTEAFAEDLDRTKHLAAAAVEQGFATGAESGRLSRGADGAPLPSVTFRGDAGERTVYGFSPYPAYRDAAISAGARQGGEVPAVEQLVARFGRVTTAEVEVVCELPGPRAGAELFRLAEQWRLRPLWRMTGYLWEAA
jgi:protein-disulfide isomerase-like protein with CxxC motif